jgi:hypothetical protein
MEMDASYLSGVGVSARPRHRRGQWSIDMSFMSDLKRYAIARLRGRRHRATLIVLNSLPADLKKDIGWNGAFDRRFE